MAQPTTVGKKIERTPISTSRTFRQSSLLTRSLAVEP
jgi:hypothetical protein